MWRSKDFYRYSIRESLKKHICWTSRKPNCCSIWGISEDHSIKRVLSQAFISFLGKKKSSWKATTFSLIPKDNGDAELSQKKKKKGNEGRNVDTQCLIITMLLGYSLFPSESGLKKVSVLFHSSFAFMWRQHLNWYCCSWMRGGC